MAGEIAYLPHAHQVVEPAKLAPTSYDSATFEGFYLRPDEQPRWKQTVEDARNTSAVGNLLDYLYDVDDLYTIEHSGRVGDLNAANTIRLGCADDVARDAAVAGYVHDVGKWHVQHLIHINGQLTDRQFEAVKPHVLYGASMVAARGLRRGLVHATGNHHGYQRSPYCAYPEALYSAEAVGPLSPDHVIGTGLAVADTFDAMRSARPGRSQPLPLAAALEAVSLLPVPIEVRTAFRSLFDETVSLDQAA